MSEEKPSYHAETTLRSDGRRKPRRGIGKGADGLTSGQRRYVSALAADMPRADAYALAYETPPGTPRNVLRVSAHQALQSPAVQRALASVRASIQDGLILDAQSIREFVQARLIAEATDDASPASARVRALELIGKVADVRLFERVQSAPTVTASDLRDALMRRLQALAPSNDDDAPKPLNAQDKVMPTQGISAPADDKE